MTNFGILIKNTSKEKELLQRHITAELDVDAALAIKIENDIKQLNIVTFA